MHNPRRPTHRRPHARPVPDQCQTSARPDGGTAQAPLRACCARRLPHWPCDAPLPLSPLPVSPSPRLPSPSLTVSSLPVSPLAAFPAEGCSRALAMVGQVKKLARSMIRQIEASEERAELIETKMSPDTGDVP